MKKIIVSLLVLNLSVLSYAQEDYDLIFDDGSKDTKLNVGIDIMTLVTGTLNAYVGYDVSESIQLKVGVGATTFGLIFDATSMFSDEVPMFQKNLNTGLFFSGGIKYFLNKDNGLLNSGAGAFYGIYLDRWENTDLRDELVSYKRTKLNVVGGSNIGLFGSFSLDFEYGLSIGYYTVETPNSSPNSYSNYEFPSGENVYAGSELIYGVNLGLVLNLGL